MTVGSQLQHARQSRRLSFADVTQETKIQPWVLEAMEADRLHEMMSPIYARGFLASYARFLHLEPEPLLAQLQWPKSQPEQEEAPLTPVTPPAIPSVIRWSAPFFRRFRTAIIVGATVVGVVVVNPFKWIRKFTPPSLHVLKVATVNTSAKPAKKLARANTHGENRQQPAQEPHKPAKEVTPTQDVTLASVAPIKDSMPSTTLPTVSMAPITPLELAVTANHATWIQVRADGKLLAQQKLPRGATERWVAKKSFEVIVAKPTQVDLLLNGESISPLAVAHEGRLLITHRGVTKLAPHDE